MYACNPSSREAEAGESGVRSVWLHSRNLSLEMKKQILKPKKNAELLASNTNSKTYLPVGKGGFNYSFLN
jgi:hypothetical protein